MSKYWIIVGSNEFGESEIITGTSQNNIDTSREVSEKTPIPNYSNREIGESNTYDDGSILENSTEPIQTSSYILNIDIEPIISSTFTGGYARKQCSHTKAPTSGLNFINNNHAIYELFGLKNKYTGGKSSRDSKGRGNKPQLIENSYGIQSRSSNGAQFIEADKAPRVVHQYDEYIGPLLAIKNARMNNINIAKEMNKIRANCVQLAENNGYIFTSIDIIPSNDNTTHTISGITPHSLFPDQYFPRISEYWKTHTKDISARAASRGYIASHEPSACLEYARMRAYIEARSAYYAMLTELNIVAVNSFERWHIGAKLCGRGGGDNGDNGDPLLPDVLENHESIIDELEFYGASSEVITTIRTRIAEILKKYHNTIATAKDCMLSPEIVFTEDYGGATIEYNDIKFKLPRGVMLDLEQKYKQKRKDLPEKLLVMLLRQYALGMCDKHRLPFPTGIFLHAILGMELFAGPLNRSINHYASINYDTDKYFGAECGPYIKKYTDAAWIVPPMIPEVIAATCLHIIEMMTENTPAQIVYLALPKFSDFEYPEYQKLKSSGYVRAQYDIAAMGHAWLPVRKNVLLDCERQFMNIGDNDINMRSDYSIFIITNTLYEKSTPRGVEIARACVENFIKLAAVTFKK